MDAAGKLVGGIWLPATETHLVEHMTVGKGRREIDGKLTYQKHKLDAALQLAPMHRRRVAVDVGAHVGLWSMWLLQAFRQLVAFEPAPLMRELWRRNVGPTDRATLHACALGNELGSVDLQIPLETTGNSHVAIGGAHPGTRGVAHPERIEVVHDVPMSRLDSFDLVNVDFIKIDVEGFEKQVLLGGEKIIRRDRPIIVVEQKGNETAYGEPPKSALRLLEKWGFKTEREIGGDFIVKYCLPCGALRAVGEKVAGALR